jgi:hypothetical protein
MRKFPKIRYPNDSATDGIANGEVVVTEKLDGANFRFTPRGDTFDIGTRNVVYEDAPNNENVPKAFYHAVDYIEREADLDAIPEDDVFFGEAMHLHSLDYDDIDWHQPASGPPHVPLSSDTPNVVIFDVWHEPTDEWLDWGDVTEAAAVAELPAARVLDKSPFDEASKEVPSESMFGGPPEGIVVRRTDGAVRAKKVTEDFREKNAVSFNDPSKAESDAAQFVASYVTDARIENVAHNLVDEGKYDELTMPMMEDLPREVLRDAMAENGWELLTDGPELEWDDDFKGEVRSKASEKCARVLKQEVQSF